MKRILSVMGIVLMVMAAEAKSIVVTLNDGTKVYYRVESESNPCLALSNDSTFALNGDKYTFLEVQSFRMSTTDYTGEEGTKEGTSDIIAIDGEQARMTGEVSVYTLDGRQVARGTDGVDLQSLPADTYVISNGKQTLKIQKR